MSVLSSMARKINEGRPMVIKSITVDPKTWHEAQKIVDGNMSSLIRGLLNAYINRMSKFEND